MANSVEASKATRWTTTVQDFLNKMLILPEIASMKMEDKLYDGKSVDFPYVNDVRVQTYTPGTDLTIDDTDATSNVLTVDQFKAVTFSVDATEKVQVTSEYFSKLTYQAAYQLKNDIEKHGMSTMVSNANGTVAGGTLSDSTTVEALRDAWAELFRANAVDGSLFVVMDAKRANLLADQFVSSGFDLADIMLRNQFAGNAAGFKVYVSNNLPSSATLGMATNPTADDTVTVAGVTFTFVAAPASAGEVDIGADVAASQANLLAAINGTGTPGATTYIDLSKKDRRKLQDAGVSMAAWASDEAVVTGYGYLNPSETFTDGTDAWGTETTQMIAGRKGALSCAIQKQPELYIRQEPKQPLDNYITLSMYGDTVFENDKDRLVKITHNA